MGTKAAKPDPVEAIAEALRAFGELTAANVADKVGMAYPTVTPKLRALEDAKRAERFKNNGRTLWRLVTPTAQVPAVTADPDTDNGAAMDLPDTGTDPMETTAPPAAAEAGAEEPLPTVTAPGAGDPKPADVSDATPTDPAEPVTATDPASAPTAALAPQTAQAISPESEPATPKASNGDAGADAAQPATDTTPAASTDGKTRRPPGALERTAMRVAQANPDREFKVTEMARLIEQADAADGHNYPNASPGAVVLACDRLVDRGGLTKVKERPATYQFAKALPANP